MDNQAARADETVSPCDILVAAMTAAVVCSAFMVAAAVTTLAVLTVVVVTLDVGVIAEIVRKEGLNCRVA